MKVTVKYYQRHDKGDYSIAETFSYTLPESKGLNKTWENMYSSRSARGKVKRESTSRGA